MNLNEVLKLRKAKYTKRYKGKDGKWIYEYGKKNGRMTAEEYETQRGGVKKKTTIDEVEKKKGVLQGESKLDAIRSIVKNKQIAKVNGQSLDLTTANVITKVADNLSEKNKKLFLAMPVEKMARIAFKLTSRKPKK